MNRTVLIIAISMLGCSYGTSIAEQLGTGGRSSSVGSGGSADVQTGGTTAAGGAMGTAGTTSAPGTGGATSAPGTGGAASSCATAATGGPTGMNSGQGCLTCHATAQSPPMTLAGTLYSAASGGNAVTGATVTVTGSNGTKVTMVTGSLGNFYSGTAVTFPATVQVSKCPDTANMSATISVGDCNSCHASTMRIHLP